MTNATKLFQVTPWFETKNAMGQPVHIMAYSATERRWYGVRYMVDAEEPYWQPASWPEDLSHSLEEWQQLAGVPPIPDETRLPQVNEVWEDEDGDPALLIEAIGTDFYTMVRQRCYPYLPMLTIRLASSLVRPGPDDKPHRFEALLAVIRRTK